MKTEIITFKSVPKNWQKEYSGLKQNTVRKQDDPNDERFQLIKLYMVGMRKLKVGIKNTETRIIFYRDITDVTLFEGYYIISW